MRTEQADSGARAAAPLHGMRILDLTIWGQGIATAMLADMGAEVIKIESYPNGDPIRGVQASMALSTEGPSPWMELANRGKKSVGINLRKNEARAVIHRLAGRSDVLATNLSVDTLSAMGLDYESLTTVNPRIIYVVNTGWGPKGPERQLPAMDLAAQARGGALHMMEQSGSIPPWGVLGMADSVGALQFAYATVLALLVRERTGVGQRIDVSLLGGQISLGAVYMQQYLGSGLELSTPSRTNVTNPLRSSYRTKDDRWICLSLLQADRYWPVMCKLLGIEHLQEDARFNSTEQRRTNAELLVPILDKAFAAKTKDEWVPVLKAYRIVFSVAQTCAEVATDPQVICNEYLTTVEHPTHGAMRVVGVPIQLSRTPGRVGAPAPEMGEHTEEVLLDVGGYTWEELAQMKDKELII